MRGIVHELYREAALCEDETAREALEVYADKLKFRLQQIERRMLRGLTYNEVIRALAGARRATHGRHLEVVR